MRIFASAAGAGALCLAVFSTPTIAGVCDLSVHKSDRGARIAEAGGLFRANDQFVVCFKAGADGHVSLWDHSYIYGDFERIAPNAHSVGDQDAVPVRAGRPHCLGLGRDGYYLAMDRGQDGGALVLVFTQTKQAHPVAGSYTQIAAATQSASPTKECAGRARLEYLYEVR